MNKQYPQPSLPARLGIAADLTFSVRDPLGYIADCLLVHDEVVLPLNASVLSWLEGVFDTGPLELLIKEKRIRFCPSYALAYANKNTPPAYDRGLFIANVKKEDFRKEAIYRKDLFDEIERTLIDSSVNSYDAWLPVRKDVDDAFEYFSNRSGYEFLFPQGEHFYFQTGAITGVARMHDLLTVGVSNLAMDQELPQLLELCFPIRKEKGVSPDAVLGQAQKVIQDLHKIENLPSFEDARIGLRRPQDEVDKIIEIVLSEEAQNLRSWLSKNLSPDLDVRAAYDSSENLLPSKKNWTNWVRFGVSAGLSTVAGMLVAGPVGALAGAAVGAADLAAGQKITALFDDYHPRMWLSHMKSTGMLKNP